MAVTSLDISILSGWWAFLDGRSRACNFRMMTIVRRKDRCSFLSDSDEVVPLVRPAPRIVLEKDAMMKT